MSSSNSSISGLIERLESLLKLGDSRPTSALFPNSSAEGAAGSLISSGESKGALDLVANGVLGGGAGLLAGLLRSFFGGRSGGEPAFPIYEPPRSHFLEYDVSPGAQPTGGSLAEDLTGTDMTAAAAPLSQRKSAPPAVIVQVNALDAQSFSARSDDIASAVREALTRNHALRDEIWEE